MPNRRLPDWFAAYEQYVEDTESPRSFHKWTAISTIAAALQKKVRLRLGQMSVFPNLYVVLVGPPGSRKSSAIANCHDLLHNIDNVFTADDATTKQALIDSMVEVENAHLINGTTYTHSSLTAVCSELESFLGQKHSNMEMVVFLTDAFDSPERDWSARTRGGGRVTIRSMYLNILAATTQESISSTMPPGAIGGGLSSRMIFVCDDTLHKKIAIPTASKMHTQMREDLEFDLRQIVNMTGEFRLREDAKEYYVNWYNNYDYGDPDRLCNDPYFSGWYQRKPLFVTKLVQVSSAGRGNSFVIETEDFERAINWLEAVELQMEHAFTGVGRNELSHEMASITKILQRSRRISEAKLLGMVMKDVDAKDFERIMQTLIRSHKVSININGTGCPVYIWKG